MESSSLGKDKVSIWGIVVGLVSWLVAGMVGMISWKRLPPELPWFYSLPLGEEMLITRNMLVVVWLLAGVMFGGNVGLSWWLAGEEALLRRFLAWGGVAFLLLLAMSVIRVVLVVI